MRFVGLFVLCASPGSVSEVLSGGHGSFLLSLNLLSGVLVQRNGRFIGFQRSLLIGLMRCKGFALAG